MLIGSRFVALALAAVVGLGWATPALAEDAGEVPVSAGTLLPQRFLAAPTSLPLTASADYVAFGLDQPDQFREATIAFHRVSDGSLVRTVARSAMLDEDGRLLTPKIVGSSFVLIAADVDAPWVEVRDIESGEVVRRWDFTGADRVLSAGMDWAFVLRSTEGTDAFLLVEPDGTARPVDIPSTEDVYARVLDVDERSILLQYDDLRIVDLADASTRVITEYGRDARLTSSRVYWTDHWDSAVLWRDRSGTGAIETTSFASTDEISSLWRWGTDGIVLTSRTANTYNPFALKSIDVAGQKLVQISGPISGVAADGNGRVLLGLTDTASGRVADFGPESASRTVLDLPLVPARSGAVAFSGEWLTTFGAMNGQDSALVTPAAGDGSWSTAQETRGIAGTFANSSIQASGDVVLGPTAEYMGYTVAWPGGQRSFISYDSLTLGRGGTLLLSQPTIGGHIDVQDARTGAVLATFARNVVADGSWIWSVENSTGYLIGHDTSGAAPDRRIHTGCSGLRDLIGRWALMNCSSQWKVVDLRGIAAQWTVPAEAGPTPILGNGFLAWLDGKRVTDGPRTLTVASLSADHGLVRYGPVWADDHYPEFTPVAVDDAGSKNLVYLDTARQARLVHLAWLIDVPLTRADKTKPVFSTSTGSARIIKSAGTRTTVKSAATYVDKGSEAEPASGLKSYDARYQTVKRGTALGSTWTEPSGWKNLAAASVTLDVAAGTDTCIAFRARDNAGNTSSWSTPRCTEVDGIGPTITKASAGSRVQSIEANATVTFVYGATDTSGVASYEVAYKAATGGKGYGPWTTPTSWKKRTSTSVPKSIPLGGDTCFRVRATDKVGNVGPWSSQKCTAVAYGETDFTAIGQTKDEREKLVMAHDTRALDDRVAVMVKAGGELRKSSITARQIGVWVIAGPNAGKLDVYIGSTKLGRISTAASTRKRVLMMLPAASKSLTGTLRVVSVDGKNAKVDAVAVLRQP